MQDKYDSAIQQAIRHQKIIVLNRVNGIPGPGVDVCDRYTSRHNSHVQILKYPVLPEVARDVVELCFCQQQHGARDVVV